MRPSSSWSRPASRFAPPRPRWSARTAPRAWPSRSAAPGRRTRSSETAVAQLEGALAERLALVDAVDHLLNRGVVLVGQTTLSLAGVDLVYLELNLLVSSVETLHEREPGAPSTPPAVPPGHGPAP